MDNPLYYVGIDIAKAKFDVAIKLQNGKHKHKVFKN
ncbi:putative transposase, partial [Glaesserella parasuis SW114]